MCVCVRARRMVFSAWGKNGGVAIPRIAKYPGSQLPPAHLPARFAAPETWGTIFSTGRGKVDSPPCEYRLPPSAACPGVSANAGRAPGACRARSPGLQSIRGRCAQREPCIQGRSPRARGGRADGRFCPGMVGRRAGKACVSSRLPLARRGCVLGHRLSQLVPPEVFSSPARSWQRLGFLKTVNYAAFVCRVGVGGGRAGPKSTAPWQNCISIG